MKSFLCLLVVFLPWPIKKLLYRGILGYDISPGAKIGLSYINVDKLVMGDNAAVGHFNVLKGHKIVELSNNSIISNFNWITAYHERGVSFSHRRNREPSLYLGEHAAITSRHILDCTDRVVVGRYSTIAGFRSQVLTHSIDLYSNVQDCMPVTIGEFVFVGTGVVILPGVNISGKIVVGAGTVVNKNLDESFSVYAGLPCKKVKELEGVSYFERNEGVVR